MIVFGVPVFRRYDLLERLLSTLGVSGLRPDKVIVVDNGNDNAAAWTAVNSWSTAERPASLLSPGKNTGCSGAWNLILDQSEPGDFVIIANDDIELARESLSIVVEAASQADLVIAHGFSLFGVSRQLVDEVGGFDENFWPIYFEDLDFHQRVRCAGKRHVHVDARARHPNPSASMKALNPHERKEFGLRQTVLVSYYRRKWGGLPTRGEQERYTIPFNGAPPKGWKLRPITQP